MRTRDTDLSKERARTRGTVDAVSDAGLKRKYASENNSMPGRFRYRESC
jgi:hypothetical protein